MKEIAVLTQTLNCAITRIIKYCKQKDDISKQYCSKHEREVTIRNQLK